MGLCFQYEQEKKQKVQINKEVNFYPNLPFGDNKSFVCGMRASKREGMTS